VFCIGLEKKGEAVIIARVLFLVTALLLFLQVFSIDTTLNIDHRISVIVTLVVFLLAILLKNKRGRA